MTASSCILLFSAVFIFSSGVQAGTIYKDETQAVICYFGSWATYRYGIGNFEVPNIDPKLCTHIVYAYTGLKNGVIASLDEYNDYEDNWGKGNMKKFVNLANSNGIKALVGIGGWNEGSQKYSLMAKTAEGREKFADSVVTYIQKFGFHGLSFDWMYPTQRGGIPADKENYVLLLQILSEKLSALGLILTVGTGASPVIAEDSYDFANIAKYADYIISLTFDYHTADEGKTAVSAPLSAEDKLNVVFTIKSLWLEAGAPANKLVVSVPAYGRTSHLKDENKHDIGDSVTGPGTPGQFTQESGLLAYFEYCTGSSWTVVHSADSSSVYAYHDAEWINYDDADTLTAKAQYVKENGLGGVMIYSLESEDFEGNCGSAYPLLTAINKALGRIS